MTKYPSTKFTREELHAYAVAGVREKILAMEREIARLQHEFPGLMVDTPIVLLKPEMRTDGKTWPLVPPPPNGAWPAKRRKAQAAAMRRLHNTGKLGKGKQAKTSGTGKVPMWRRIQAALVAAPDQQATAQELIAATGANSFANIAGSASAHAEFIKRVRKGVYTLTAAGARDAAKEPTA